ncbi:MAG: hypothetical protein JSV91_01620 [Phycisphaerales bacterium]|nr:MAG: hypothetical protein JSV91_01620 [Phycisphaerales bacterium]
MNMQVQWRKGDGNLWCRLNTVDLTHRHFDGLEGVYVIWHGGDNPAVLRIGQGAIREKLTEHRGDVEVQQHDDKLLMVTWAAVPQAERDGVEKYLADELQPLLGDRFADRSTVEVNLPW